MLRILQEAFSNVLQHSAATQMRVSTQAERDGLVVLVDDNGRGIDPAGRGGGDAGSGPIAGRGRANMLRRAAVIGDTVQCLAKPLAMQLRLWLQMKRDLA